MEWTIHNYYGGIHLLTGIICVISAVIILFSEKGTEFHKKIGYVYVGCIILMNFSSFGVTEFVNGSFGPFHFGSLVSLFFTIIGTDAAIRKKGPNWLRRHYYYINGSIIGLFAAFFVEAVFRTFKDGTVIIVATILISTAVATIGTVLMRKYKSNFLSS
jgi:uncharacterized membrane protein